MKLYYIYVLKDPRDNQPFYVGKGKHLPGRTARWRNHISEARTWDRRSGNSKKLSIICELLDVDKEPICELLYQTNIEQQALFREKETISQYGRIVDDSGPLTNLSVGGDGLDARKLFQEEEKIRRSERMKGKNNPNYGKERSETTRMLISDTRKQRIKSGEITPTVHSEQHKQHLSNESKLGKLVAKQVCQICPTTKKILQVFPSSKRAGETLNIKSWRNISVVCNKYPTRKVAGYLWKWDD